MQLFKSLGFLLLGFSFVSGEQHSIDPVRSESIGIITHLSNALDFLPVTASGNTIQAASSDSDRLPGTDYHFPDTGTISKAPLKTVSTFQNISLYWKPAEGASNREALVRYRVKGTANWSQAQSLWFDDREPDSIGNNKERSKEFRG